MYDVIVVGAGPAGSTAATVSARNGLRVLLVDRETFPRDKACGDAIPASSFTLMAELGLSQPFNSEEFFPIDRFIINGPKGVSATINFPPNHRAGTCIVRRYIFDEVLRLHAIHCGAKLRLLRVTGLITAGDQVVGIKANSGKKKVELHSKVVIAADGATSTIARALKVPQPDDKNKAIAIRGYIRTVADLDPCIELSFIDKFHPGFAWFLPIGKRLANVGIGMRVDQYKQNSMSLSEALRFFLGRSKMRARVDTNKVEDLRSWQIPMFINKQRRLFNGVILVGDAGGFVSPLTGSGIYQAMATAKYAAEASIDAIQKNNLTANGLSLFEKLWRKDLVGEMRRALIMQRILTLVPHGIDALLFTTRLSPILVRYLIGTI
jgi:geranylgeranyl reductase family protein